MSSIGTKFRPSGADRFINCPASVVAAQYYEADDSTVYSDAGTVAHGLAEACLISGEPPETYLGEQICIGYGIETEVSSDMVDSVNYYLNWVKNMAFTEKEIEMKLSFPWINNAVRERTTGKADLIGYSADFDELYVVDYKNGVKAVPDNSYQFALYAIGVMDFEKYAHLNSFKVARVQPNVRGGTPIGTYEWSRDELLKVKSLVMDKVAWVNHTTQKDLKDEDFHSGDWCAFCPVKKCPAKAKKMFDVVKPEEALPAPSILTPEKIKLVLEKRTEIKQWLDDVYQFYLTEALQGKPVEGFKIVEGRSLARAWKKELKPNQIVEALAKQGVIEAECYQEPKLITPATAKKILKGKFENLSHVMSAPEKSVTLVPDSDKRSAKDGSDLFTAIPSDNTNADNKF